MREFIWRPQGKIPATLTGVETFTNKTIISPTVSGGTFIKPTVSGGTQKGSVAASGATYTSPTLVNAKINTGISNAGSGFQHRRITVTVGGTLSLTVTVVWNTAFADVNYTPGVSILATFAPVGIFFTGNIISKTTAAIRLGLRNADAVGHIATVNGWAFHD